MSQGGNALLPWSFMISNLIIIGVKWYFTTTDPRHRIRKVGGVILRCSCCFPLRADSGASEGSKIEISRIFKSVLHKPTQKVNIEMKHMRNPDFPRKKDARDRCHHTIILQFLEAVLWEWLDDNFCCSVRRRLRGRWKCDTLVLQVY